MVPVVLLLLVTGVRYDCWYDDGELVVAVACAACDVQVCGGRSLVATQKAGFTEVRGAVPGERLCVGSDEVVHVSSRSGTALSHIYLSNPAVVGNHNPSFLVRGIDITVSEDSGAYLKGEQYVTDINDNNGFTQNVRFQVINDNNLLFDTQPHIIGCSVNKCAGTLTAPAGTGTLFFSVAPNQYGKARVEVVAIDDGYEQPVCDGPPLDPMGNKCSVVPCNPSICTHSVPQYFWIEVIPVNDPPSFDHKGDVTSLEDQPTCHDKWATGVTPGPGEAFGTPDYQPLHWSVTTAEPELFTTPPFILYSQGANTASLCYEPAPNKVGIAHITVTLTDGGHPPLSFPTQYVSVTITEVNDPPSFTPLSASVVVLEDSGPYDAVWARDMVPGPPEEVAAGQQLGQFLITYEDPAQSALFAKEPGIDVVTGRLQFTPRQDANTFHQPVTLKVKLEDKVVAPDAPLTSEEVTLVITITPVNDPPSYLAGEPIVVWEDEPLAAPMQWATSLCVGSIVQNTCDQSEGDKDGEAQELVFTVTPKAGDMTMFTATGMPEVDATGHVMFAVFPNKVGETKFDVTLKDTGPQPNVGPTHELVIRIMPVNDPPTFALATHQVQVIEDSGSNVIEPFLVNVTKGPYEPDESTQSIACTVGVEDEGLFHPLGGYPKVVLTLGDTKGSLMLIPAPNAKGSTEGWVTCKDDGGTARGGVDKTVSDRFLITIINVNDPPNFALPPAVIVQEDSAPFGHVITSVASNITAGQEEGGAESVVFEVTTYDTRMFTAAPKISPQGTLTFTLAPDANGNATSHVVAIDRLKADTANSTFTGLRSNVTLLNITVVSVNDPPRVVFNGSVAGPQGLQGLRVPVCYERGGCEHTIRDVFAEVSVGPLDETENQVLDLSIVVPVGAQSYVSSVNVSGDTQWYAHPAAYGGKHLTFGLKETSPDVVLPSDLKLVLIASDGQRELNTTVVSIPFALYHPWVPSKYPTQLVVSQQPAVEGDRVTAEFTLQDSMQNAHPDAALLDVEVYNMVTAEKSRFMTLKADTAQAVYPVSADGVPPGVYYLDATATLSNKSVLTARSAVFTVDNDLVTPVAYRNSTPVPAFNEYYMRSEDLYVELLLAKGAWNTSASAVDVVCAVYQYNGAVPCNGTLVRSNNIRVTVRQNSAFNITADSSLEIRLPPNLLNYNSDAFSHLLTVPVHASPVVYIVGNMTTAGAIRVGGQPFSVTVVGATWVEGAASVAADAFVSSYAGSNGYNDLPGLLSIVAVSPTVLKAVVGPDPRYNPATAETLSVDPELLAPALSTMSIPPELRANNFTIGVGGLLTRTTECVPDGKSWKLAALVLSIIGTMLCVVAAPCASLSTATYVVLAATMATGFEVPCDGTLGRVQDGLAWVIDWGANSAFQAVLAAAIVLTHFAVVCGYSAQKSIPFADASVHLMFPNLSITPFMYLTCGVLFNAINSAGPAPIASAVVCVCAATAVWLYGTEKAATRGTVAVVEMARDRKLLGRTAWVGDHAATWGAVFQFIAEGYLRWSYVEYLCVVATVVLCGLGGGEVPRLALVAVCWFVHGVGCSVVGVRLWIGEAVLVLVCDTLLMMVAVVMMLLHATNDSPKGGHWQTEVASGLLLMFLITHCCLCLACLANKWSTAQSKNNTTSDEAQTHVTSNPIAAAFDQPPPPRRYDTRSDTDTASTISCHYCGTPMLGTYCHVCGAK